MWFCRGCADLANHPFEKVQVLIAFCNASVGYQETFFEKNSQQQFIINFLNFLKVVSSETDRAESGVNQ